MAKPGIIHVAGLLNAEGCPEGVTMNGATSLDVLAACIRELREAAGLSRSELARVIPYDRSWVSKAESGAQVPPEALIAGMERVFGTTKLAPLRRRAQQEQRGQRSTPFEGAEEGVTDANRRQLFELGAAGLLAATTYRARSGVEPDALTLSELDDAVSRHATMFTTTPHPVLATRVYGTWRSAEQHLEKAGGRPRTQARLCRTAGYCSYMLSRLAFNLGDTTASRRFLALAGDHTDQVDDIILSASVSGMTSTLAFYGHRYQESAREAARGAATADHPYMRARLRAYEARALAAMGDGCESKRALTQMRSAVVDLPTRPGSSPLTDASADMFAAGALTRIGEGDAAEPIARAAVDAFDNGSAVGFEEHGHALFALATALMRRQDPRPDEAAGIALQAVDMLDQHPTASVTAKALDFAAQVQPFTTVSGVRDLRERLRGRPGFVLDPT